jgi:hypothetical protein
VGGFAAATVLSLVLGALVVLGFLSDYHAARARAEMRDYLGSKEGPPLHARRW